MSGQYNTASLLLIGNEILSGKIQDSNGYYTAGIFRRHGIELEEIRAVKDDHATIVRHIKELRTQTDYLITSGGLGPTHDDVTMKAIADAVDDQFVLFEDMLASLKKGYGKRFTPAVEKMAWLPSRTRLVRSHVLQWPLIQVDNIFILPGVPQLYQKKIEGVCELLKGPPCHLEELYLGVDESLVADTMEKLDRNYAAVEIGSYPVWENSPFKVKVTFESRDADLLKKVIGEFRAAHPTDFFVDIST